MNLQAATPGQRWCRAAFLTMAWWPVLAFVLYSVYFRVERKYFVALLSASGLEHSQGISDQLFLYRQDLILVGVLVPLLMAASFVYLRFTLAAVVWAVAILASQLLLYANLQSWGQVGRFLTWPALVNAVSFGTTNPNFIGEYLSLDGILKLAFLLATSTLVVNLGHRLDPRSWLVRLGALITLACLLTALSVAAMGWTSKMRPAPITNSFFANSVDALAFSEQSTAQAPVAADQLNQRLLELSLQRTTDYRGSNFGLEQGSNLLMFVLETGSIEFLDIRKGLPEHPVLRLLSPKLFLAQNHFSTFPASAESNLSILTGVYPPRAIYETCLVERATAATALPGYIPALRSRGYKTAIYAPFRSQVPGDKVVFERTGFEKTFYGISVGNEVDADANALKELTADIKGWTRQGQRFAAAFFPQIGHGPWDPELGSTVQQRGHRLAMQQLDWLAQLVEVLRAAGQLDKTVIVLTGDHGVRTTLEDPRVRVGMIDQYSLHVPLIIYAPNADLSSVPPTVPSSHVDLAAELAHLFGVRNLQAIQGLPFGHTDLSTRRQFFMANWYYGADGYRDAQGASMYSSILDIAYSRRDGQLNFGSAETVRDPAETARIRAITQDILNLQDSWISHRLCGLP